MNITRSPLITSLTEKCIRKENLYNKHKDKFFLRAFMGGIIVIIYTLLGAAISGNINKFLLFLTNNDPAYKNVAFSISKMFFAFNFAWALILIIFLNTELFTATVMYSTVEKMHNKRKLSSILGYLTFTFLGNLIGCVVGAAFMSIAKIQTVIDIEYLTTIMQSKFTKNALSVFLSAILATMIVNFAVVLANKLKEEINITLLVIICVFTFAFLGFEHIIATFGIFFLAFFGGSTFDLFFVLNNFIFAFLGNIVGAMFIGYLYTHLNRVPEHVDYLD